MRWETAVIYNHLSRRMNAMLKKMTVAPRTCGTLRKALAEWYTENRRDLPWRRTGDPYRIWVSEVMLQQTPGPNRRALFPPLHFLISGRQPPGPGRSAGGAQVVGRAGILLQGPQPA